MDKGEGCVKNRIYVGGLGENVTAEDLKNTFSSPQLGSVRSVDIIRTKGRGFAYLDFVPSSDQSILKLFSKYNGCMWKGGRLRLEKAKEHFLIRLERERAEDTEIDVKVSSAPEPPPLSVMKSSLDKLKKNQAMDKMQLHIYFPKLRKIKPIPFKGSGKHKYSFQRVEVPPFPIHFCDCEEHSGSAYYTAKENETEIKMGGVDENEMNIMSSVLNKILKRENHSETAVTKKQNVNNVADYSMREEDMVDEDDDGIIINVTKGRNYGTSSSYAVSQKSGTHDLHFPESKHTLDVQKSSIKVNFASKKRKVPQDGGGAVDNLSAINDKKHRSHAHGGVAIDASHIEPNFKADLHVVDIETDIIPGKKQLCDQSGKKELHSESNGGDEPTMKADLHTADIGVEIIHGKKQWSDQSETKELQSKSNQSKSNGGDEPTMKADLHTADIGVEITPGKKQWRAQRGKKELESTSLKSKSYDVEEPTVEADLNTTDIGVEITPGKKQWTDQSEELQSKCKQSKSNGVEEPTVEADLYTTDIEVKIIPPEKNRNQSHAQVGVAVNASRIEPNMKTDIAVDVGVGINLPEENQFHDQSGKKELQAKSNDVDLSCFSNGKPQEKPQHIGEASSSQENASGDKSSARGSSWLQTRSWAQLVGDARNSSFSISQFLPSLNIEKRPDSTTNLVESQKQRQDSSSSKTVEGTILDRPTPPSSISQFLPGLNIEKRPDSTTTNLVESQKQREDSSSSKTVEGTILDHPTPPRSSMEFASSEEKKNSIEVAGVSVPDDHKEDNMNDEEKKHKFTMKQTPLPDIGGSFSFTRNAASMRQWRKAKSALSGTSKKKAL